MDPTGVLKSLWRYRWYVVPALLITFAVAAYVYFLGPRLYESTISYALVNPDVPTEADIERQPSLAKLNGDNPYLRSTDPNLVANVVITRLQAPATAAYLEDAGLGREFTVEPGVGGSGYIVEISGVGSTAQQSLRTSSALGVMFERELRSIQLVNGADDRFLFTSLVVAEPDRASEQFSSRLRSIVIVLAGGAVLVFAAVSLGRGVDATRARRRRRSEARARAEAEAAAAEAAAVAAAAVAVGTDTTPAASGLDDLYAPFRLDWVDDVPALDDADDEVHELDRPPSRR
ncbi:chain-length determining protein [Agromyces sp. PvR057]|uniref:chain-length determining protein n=1 Tax=Agromyces sp. PvR057 TaxID=3156403 RepID=UPI0033915C49